MTCPAKLVRHTHAHPIGLSISPCCMNAASFAWSCLFNATFITLKDVVQVSGRVDQSAGMLDEEVKDKGYALLCVSEPRSDCRIQMIDEVHLILPYKAF